MKYLAILGIATCSYLLTSCSPKLSNLESLSQDSSFNNIVLEPIKQSKLFPDAALGVVLANSTKLSRDSANFRINYSLTNFKLTEMTVDQNTDHCANSGNGQHIHFILDNKPYVALYKPVNVTNLALNSEHYLLSFLSRSYHESVKNPSSSVLLHFKIDENGNYIKLPNPNSPMIFYSRPKGEYTGKDIQNILLDFYVLNSDLKTHKIKLSINDRVFILDKWQPYFLKNVPKGNINIGLKLINNNGQHLTGPNTEVNRVITVK